MFGLMRRTEEQRVERGMPLKEENAAIAAKVAAEAKAALLPSFPDKPKRAESPIAALSDSAIAEYAEVASSLGFESSDLTIERFKAFMAKNDLPMYDLKEVVSYMDALAKRDNKSGYGWYWSPMRKADTVKSMRFGVPASHEWNGERNIKKAASDYFDTLESKAIYDKAVPLHALKRAQMVTKEFGDQVVFAVSDYATEPHVLPDPFLLAIIPNKRLKDGIGRFVIDVWDEPGFGIVQMVKG